MILYLDTSAIVKKYFKETGSTDIISLWKKSMTIATSSIAYAEAMASFFRKKKEADITEKTINKTINIFQKDWGGFVRIKVNNDLNEKIDRLVALHPLRGFDAIHLASALIVNERVPETFLFACFDKRLLKAAITEGLKTFPAEIE
jgi:predicted nucleic acid-binding protein